MPRPIATNIVAGASPKVKVESAFRREPRRLRFLLMLYFTWATCVVVGLIGPRGSASKPPADR